MAKKLPKWRNFAQSGHPGHSGSRHCTCHGFATALRCLVIGPSGGWGEIYTHAIIRLFWREFELALA